MGGLLRGRGSFLAGAPFGLGLEPWPGQVQQSVCRGRAVGPVPNEQAQPQRAIEDIESIVDVEVGPELAGGDPVVQSGRAFYRVPTIRGVRADQVPPRHREEWCRIVYLCPA